MVDPSTHLAAPAPVASALGRLLAAVLATDASAVVLERSSHSARIRIAEPGTADAVAFLLETPDGPAAEALSALEASIQAALASYKSQRNVYLHVVVVNSRGLDVEPLLAKLVPRASLFRGGAHAHVWMPGGNLKTVRGLGSTVLARAVKHLNVGGTAVNLEAVSSVRSQQLEEAGRFFAAIGVRRPVVTWTLAVLSVALFGLQMLWGGGEAFVAAPRMGAAIGELIKAGQIWRLLAPMMLHGNVMHLAFNMMALLSFSPFLEKFLGWRRYLLLYVASGLGGSLAGLLRTQDVTSVGASGAIWGLMVAGAALVTWPRGRLPELVSTSQRTRAWTPVALNAMYSFRPGIDWLAHLGGGAVGALLILSGALTAFPPEIAEAGDGAPPARESFVVRALAVFAAIVTVASVVAALATGRPWELRTAPSLHRVRMVGSDTTVEIPQLIVPPQSDAANATWIFGGLRYDPVCFIFFLPPSEISDEEAANNENALESARETTKPEVLRDFSVVTPTELRKHGEVPYLYNRQTTQDQRSAETYTLIRGKRVVQTMVLTSSITSDPWRAAASEVPFSMMLGSP
jgi:rhomboid protease GluP